MKACITINVEVESEQESALLRDTAVRAVKEAEVEATVTSGSSALLDEDVEFTVTGVDMDNEEPFTVTVEAANEHEAKKMVEVGVKVVADVRASKHEESPKLEVEAADVPLDGGL